MGDNKELYYVKQIKDDISDWNRIIEVSKDATPFMRDDYLRELGYTSDKYIVYRKDKPYMGICIPININTGESENVVPYAPYQGLLYTQNDDVYSDYHNNLEATEILLDYLFENGDYRKIGFSNSIFVKDLRAVQWHHYHNTELGKYELSVHYTAVKSINEESDVYTGLSKGRKLDYKYSKERYNIDIEMSNDIDIFMDLYYKTFSRQDIYLDENDISRVKRLLNYILSTKIGELWFAIDKNTGEAIDATVMLYDKNNAYYLFGANDPEHRKKGGGTLLLLEQMKEMTLKGVNSIDFIGVNSPFRGDFKLGFGARIMPYFECSVNYNI